MRKRFTYKDAGVDLDAADRFEEMIKERVHAVWPEMGEQIGRFAGRGRIPAGAVEIAGPTDGTGSKMLVAAMLGDFAGIGQDAVAMAAVDAYVDGSRPLYITDTLKVARLKPELHIRIIESVIRGCVLAGCKLFNGETAERPDLFRSFWMADLDATAFAFPEPALERAPVIPGQKVYGWPSYGPAANGFSLIRKLFDIERKNKDALTRLARRHRDLGESLAEALLRPTPIWIPQIEEQRKRGVVFSGHAHITGGGMPGNIPRILPFDCKVIIDRNRWDRPPIFSLIQRKGGIGTEEMLRVFNEGIIMVSIVDGGSEDINDPHAILIGQVERRRGDEPQVEFC